MFGRVRFRWALAIPVVVIAVAVAVVARSDGGAQAPLLSLHLTGGQVPAPPFTLGAGAYHVDALYNTGCQGGVYVIYVDPQTVPPHTTAPEILPVPIQGTRWQNDFAIAGPRRFLVGSDSEALAFQPQPCTADVRITRTGNASGPPEMPPVGVHCALEAVPCAIPGTLAPGQYTIRFATKCGDWWLDGVDAQAEHLSGLAQTTASYDGATSAWLDDFSVPAAGRYSLTHALALGNPSNGLCSLDAQVYRLSDIVPSAGASGDCRVTAFADTKPDPDGHSLDIVATALPEASGSPFCMVDQTVVRVSLVGANGIAVATQGSPETFESVCPTQCYAGARGSLPLVEPAIGPLVWSNWCGGPVHAVVDVSVDGVAAHTTLTIPTPPACTAPGQTPTLRRVLVLH